MIKNILTFLFGIFVYALMAGLLIGGVWMVLYCTYYSIKYFISSVKVSGQNTTESINQSQRREKELIELISKRYYIIEDKISFRCCYEVSTEYIMILLSNKKVFQSNNKFSCTVTQINESGFIKYDVDIEVKYTQGFKVLMASINPHLENKLNSTEHNVLSEIKRIYALIIKPGMSPYEKEKAVHDYLIRASMYDTNGLNSNNISEVSHTPYGLLFNHMGVCDAYAETFQIFMYLCGIESYVVIGDTISNINKEYKHAWNIIKLGKFYYHVDVTFDNPGPMKFGQVDYKYFNKSDVEMEKTHTWEVMQYPFCLDY